MVFNFSGYPHAILPYIYYTFYRRKENFIKLIWKNTFCEIERSKFNRYNWNRFYVHFNEIRNWLKIHEINWFCGIPQFLLQRIAL